ncbi:N-acetylmuramoyl-L-alanine amidase [Kamptonema formosum]|uniref:N-acetylmuramoyl-L-alanine amidase n=1 Tax=Kamptonema formosum TaxID=331992 RepID=UPI000345FBFE|nr:N-acetylmuramoyl-L-alanine amidase [Kamptonema formosum]
MRFHWLLPSFLSVFLLSSAAEAARLQSWRFDANQNRLYFTTVGGVQPKAQLIFNPTRLVIDLPETSLGRSSVTQPVTGGFESVRVGQFDAQTTRIVVELSPGYTLDPQQVRFRGISPSQWTVELPRPTAIATGDRGQTIPPPTTNPQPQIAAAGTLVENVQVTKDGFFIRTSGGKPEISLQQSRAGDLATIDIAGANISPQLTEQEQVVNQHGVDRIEVRQLPTDPPMTRVTLRMTETNTNWRAFFSNMGGIVVLPTNRPNVSSRPPLLAPRRNTSNLAGIQSIDLTANGTQLLIRTDRAVSYTSGWNQQSGAYWLRIPKAQLAGQIPQLQANSPVGLTATQEDSETVVIWVQPAAGVQVTRVLQPTPQILSVQLRRTGVSSVPPVTNPTPSLNPRNYPTPELPRNSNGRIVVAIDPGHGGGDPGAVGIGGLQEKGIVLDISQQVAAILEQQGVQTILTRTDDREIDLQPRVDMAERVNATLFVSIHANAIDMSRPDVNGIETYYFSSGENLARTIHNSILQGTGARDRRVRQARFYVLRKSSMPSVLLEVGFVTGAEDAARLRDPAYRSQMAASIARGILLYLRQGN